MQNIVIQTQKAAEKRSFKTEEHARFPMTATGLVMAIATVSVMMRPSTPWERPHSDVVICFEDETGFFHALADALMFRLVDEYRNGTTPYEQCEEIVAERKDFQAHVRGYDTDPSEHDFLTA